MASVAKRKWTHKGVEKEAWVVRYFDEKGARRSKQFDQKKPADAYKRKVEREIEDGTHTASGASVTMAVLAAHYIESLDAKVADGRIALSTRAQHKTKINGYILPSFGPTLLCDLNENTVDAWFLALSKKVEHVTAKQAMQCLVRLLEYGRRRKWLATNPAREVATWPEHRGHEKRPIRTFTIEEVKALMASIQALDRGLTMNGARRARKGWRHRTDALARCTIYLAAMCGLRAGEVMGLTRDHIDFDRGLILVRHSLDPWDTLRAPKTRAGKRDVPMPAMLAIELRQWLDRFYIPNDRGLLFRTMHGKQMSHSNFYSYVWQHALEDAGLGGQDGDGRHFHFHALRHFYASMLVNARMPLPDVARLLGHKSFDVTLQVYTHALHQETTAHATVETLATQLRAIGDATVTHGNLAA